MVTPRRKGQQVEDWYNQILIERQAELLLDFSKAREFFNAISQRHFPRWVIVLNQLVNGEHSAKPNDRRLAAEFLVEQAIGKAPEKVEVSASDKLERCLADIIAAKLRRKNKSHP